MNEHSMSTDYQKNSRANQFVLAIAFMFFTIFMTDYAKANGKEVFEERCTMCHELPDPEKLTSEEWVVTLEEMALNAGLNNTETGDVLEFLQSHSRKATKIVSMAKERKLFEEKCSLCHTTDRIFIMPLTKESRHHIVKRMQERASGWITPKEAQGILAYLNQGTPETNKPVRKKTNGGSAELFRERCTACHTAERIFLKVKESKKSNKAPEWLHIVKRMREKAPEWVTEKEAGKIMQYLKSLKGNK